MFWIVGAVVAGGAAVALHDDHSDYSDHSQYSDADILMKIKAKKEKLRAAERSVANMERQLEENVRADWESLADDPAVKEAVERAGYTPEEAVAAAITRPAAFGKRVQEKITELVEEEIESDQRQLDEINAAIMKINSYQLNRK